MIVPLVRQIRPFILALGFSSSSLPLKRDGQMASHTSFQLVAAFFTFSVPLEGIFGCTFLRIGRSVGLFAAVSLLLLASVGPQLQPVWYSGTVSGIAPVPCQF